MSSSNIKKLRRPLLSIDPWIFGIPHEETMAFAKKIGFDGIEYMLTLRDLAFGVDEIISYSKKIGMPITSLHQPLLLLIHTPELLFNRMRDICTAFPDVKLINHHLSAFMFGKPFSRKALLYKKLFEAAGFTVSYESNPHAKIATIFPKPTYDAIAFQEFCQEYQLPMNLDVCHIASVNYDIVKFFSDNHTLIRLIHLSDYQNGVQHLPIREGNLPIKELLAEIKRTRWNGTITFEIFKFLNQQSKKEKFLALEKSLTFVHENL